MLCFTFVEGSLVDLALHTTRFLNPDGLQFEAWFPTFRGVKVFDMKESPYATYGDFSDESLFRALLSGTPGIPVIWVDTPKVALIAPNLRLFFGKQLLHCSNSSGSHEHVRVTAACLIV